MFLLSKDIEQLEHDEYLARANEYEEYLESIRESLSLDPPNFIFEDWYRNPSSHKCLHDSWLERLTIEETPENDVFIEMRLLAAYHDGYITMRYSGVKYYSLKRHKTSRIRSSHGDLRYEEFRLDNEGNMIHEFDWYTLDENGVYLIACESIKFSWEDSTANKKSSRKPEWEANDTV